MAGLLDSLGSDDGMLGLYLLAAGAAKPQRTSLGEGLLGGMQLMQQQRQGREDRAARDEERKQRAAMQAMQMQLMQAQVGETQAQAAHRQAQAQQAAQALARQQAFQQRLGAPTSPQEALAGGGGPTPQNAAMIGQQRAPDWQSLALQFPDQVELIKKLAESGNFGRQEVGRVEETMADGRPVRQQFDKFGAPIGAALPQWKAPEKIDTGGQIGMIDPVTLKMLGQFSKTNTPDALLGAQTTMRGQNMTDARSRESNQVQRDAVGKVDWKQDVNGAWVGLPKEVSGTGPVTPVTTTSAGKREQQARNALDIIGEAEKLIDKGTGSYIGAGVDMVGKAFGGATPGAVAGGQLKALEGALMMAQPRMEGPQSNMDVQLYRQMAAQIGDPTVPPKIKKAALATVKELHQKYSGQAAPASPAGPSVDDLLKKYGN
jgi:hypothetical protein